MSAEIIDINERARDAWDAFLACRDRAMATGDFEDALKVGRAWRTFLNLFLADDQKMTVAPKTLEFQLRELHR